MVCTTRYLLNAAITVGWVVLCPSVYLRVVQATCHSLAAQQPVHSTTSHDSPHTHIQQANVSTVIGVIFMRTETAAISFDNDCQHVVLVSLPHSLSPPIFLFSLFLLNLHICFGALYSLFNDTWNLMRKCAKLAYTWPWARWERCVISN